MGDLEAGCPAPTVSPAAEPPYNAGCQRKSPGRLEDSFMSRSRCRYCDQDNPADSKFCSSCGGALHLPPHLVSCPRCGTVNPIKATVCCWCKDQLPGRRSLPRPRSPVIVGTAVLAAVAVLGYYTYRQRSFADAPQPPAASSDAGGRSAPAEAGFLDRNAAAGDTKSAGVDDGAALTSSAASPAAPLRAAADPPRAGRPPVKSEEAKASEPAPLRPEACTDATAALGLCAMKSAQKKEPETAAAVEAAVKRPQTTGAGKAGGQEPTCTEGAAALGLCTPKPIQRRE